MFVSLLQTTAKHIHLSQGVTESFGAFVLKKSGEKILQLHYLHGEAVRHHHDDQWDEEGHKGANQHEALLVEDTAAIDEDLVLIEEANHWDWH